MTGVDLILLASEMADVARTAVLSLQAQASWDVNTLQDWCVTEYIHKLKMAFEHYRCPECDTGLWNFYLSGYIGHDAMAVHLGVKCFYCGLRSHEKSFDGLSFDGLIFSFYDDIRYLLEGLQNSLRVRVMDEICLD